MSINNFFDKNLRLIFLLIILAELLSFLGYFSPAVNFITFFIIVFLTVILSLYNLKYGLYILLAELFIGSFGYLFYFEQGGVKLSIRQALWLIIMSVWLAKTILAWIKTKKLSIIFFKSAYFSYFFILFIFIAWGVINGLANKNFLSDIFFDFNNWLYFLLIFPLFELTRDKNNLSDIKQIFLASISWLSVKTLFLAYFFSHNFNFFLLDFYRWVRLSGVGEITQVVPGFSRVFLQSHIFVLLGLFIILFYLLKAVIDTTLTVKKFLTSYFLLLTLLLSAIIVSFSRSFWLGLAAGGLAVWLIAIFKLKIKQKQFFIFNGLVILLVCFSLAFTAATLKFPYPAPASEFDAANILSGRATTITGEAGASSRWQLLRPLLKDLKSTPWLGQGFGATVTYQSSDPRVLSLNANGEYTTYAFEWGWLDVWLKLGLFGLLAYLILFIKIIIDGLKTGSYFSLSLSAGLIIIITVNIFSPYVNHPLGIGYIILASATMECVKNLKLKSQNVK